VISECGFRATGSCRRPYSVGLRALCTLSVETRIKEIGIRKAMGAASGDIFRLLTWEFARPVLWANVIAWPIAYFAMNWWLSGFAYRIDLSPWLFLAAGGLVLLIALVSTALQSLQSPRAKPVTALRYE